MSLTWKVSLMLAAAAFSVENTANTFENQPIPVRVCDADMVAMTLSEPLKNAR